MKRGKVTLSQHTFDQGPFHLPQQQTAKLLQKCHFGKKKVKRKLFDDIIVTI